MKKYIAALVVGSLMLAGASSAFATPITYDGTLSNGVPSAGVNTQVSANAGNPAGADYWMFFATAGSAVSVLGGRLADHYDMSLWVLFGTFADTAVFGAFFDAGDSTFVMFADDEIPHSGPFNDPNAVFVAPFTGFYTVAVTNFASGLAQPPNPYQLTATGVAATAVPEPASMLLLGTGLLGLAALRRRSRKS